MTEFAGALVDELITDGYLLGAKLARSMADRLDQTPHSMTAPEALRILATAIEEASKEGKP